LVDTFSGLTWPIAVFQKTVPCKPGSGSTDSRGELQRQFFKGFDPFKNIPKILKGQTKTIKTAGDRLLT
jgi:hypothetical protein